MKRAVILHGMPSSEEYHSPKRESQSNSHWLPWLQQQLSIRDILTQTPELPMPYQPAYDAWKEEFERQAVDTETILVGHSCGAGFLVRWLSENDKRVRRVVLVAPWLDPTKKHGSLFEFVFDPALANKTEEGIHVLNSTNDGKEVHDSVALIKTAGIDYTYHEFENYGHFTFGGMKTREFPELVEICLS